MSDSSRRYRLCAFCVCMYTLACLFVSGRNFIIVRTSDDGSTSITSYFSMMAKKNLLYILRWNEIICMELCAKNLTCRVLNIIHYLFLCIYNQRILFLLFINPSAFKDTNILFQTIHFKLPSFEDKRPSCHPGTFLHLRTDYNIPTI